MKKRNQRKLLALGLAGALLTLNACDDGLGGSGNISWINDPPKVFLIAGGKLVAIRFKQFGTGFRVVPVNSIPVPGAVFSPVGRSDFGGLNLGTRHGDSSPDPTLDFPAPDDFDFPPPDDLPDPWDVPFPDDPFPFPVPPDLPDPFDGLPDPPPFPDDDIPFTSSNDGSLSASSGAGEGLAQGKDPIREAQDQGRSAKIVKIRIGAQAAGFRFSPDRKRVYVAYAQGIAVVDRIAATVVDQIPLPPEVTPKSIAISPDGKRLYVASFVRSAAQLYTVDLATKAVVGTVPVGGFPAGVAVTPDGSQVWVSSYFSGNVTVVDTLTNTRVTVISGVSSAWSIQFNPRGTRAYVTSSESVGGNLKVIDTARYAIIATIPAGNGARAIGVTPSGRHVFVANFLADTVTQIDAINNTVVRTIQVGKKPAGFKFLQ